MFSLILMSKWIKKKFICFFIGINDKINNEGDELVKFIKNKNSESIDLRPVLAKSAANVLLQVKFILDKVLLQVYTKRSTF